MGGKTPGSIQHYPTQAHSEDNQRQWERKGSKKQAGGGEDPREGGYTIQYGEPRRVTMETSADKFVGKANYQRETRTGTKRDKTLRKVDAQSKNNWRQGKQDPWKGRRNIQQREARRGTSGDKTATRPSTRGTHHPTNENENGYNMEDRGEFCGKPKHHRTNGNKKVHNGRHGGDKTLEKAGAPSIEGPQGDTTPWRRRRHHPYGVVQERDKILEKAGAPSL